MWRPPARASSRSRCPRFASTRASPRWVPEPTRDRRPGLSTSSRSQRRRTGSPPASSWHCSSRPQRSPRSRASSSGIWPGLRACSEPEPEPEPELPPAPPLSPLEQALILLEQSIRVDGAADQRRALELVAEELELADWGDRDLARTARALAWSEGVPPANETTRLAARVRTALPREEESAELNGNGNVV